MADCGRLRGKTSPIAKRPTLMVFEDRRQAGELLCEKLKKLKLDPKKSIIAAIPRGGVIVAEAVSKKLSIPLGVIVIKKLSPPFNPELAIGATASFGKPILDRWLIADLKVSNDYLKKEIIKKRKEARAREKYLHQELSASKFKGKTVIVIDDGMATGQTARAAARIIRAFEPAKLILAVPCAPPATIDSVSEDYDKVICLQVDANLMAVGQFYGDFRPIEDQEVREILARRN